MHQYLAHGPAKEPKLKYFSNCKDSIRTIPSLIHDDIKPEDLNTHGEDHAADPDRYLLLRLHEDRAPEEMSLTERKLQRMYAMTNNLNSFYFGE